MFCRSLEDGRKVRLRSWIALTPVPSPLSLQAVGVFVKGAYEIAFRVLRRTAFPSGRYCRDVDKSNTGYSVEGHNKQKRASIQVLSGPILANGVSNTIA